MLDLPWDVTKWIPWLTPQTLLWIMTGVLALVYMLQASTHRVRLPSTTGHGTAKWATRREMMNAGVLNDEGMYLAKAHGQYVRAPFERNVVVFGPPGSGKSLTNVLTSLTDCDDADVLVLDTSGNLVDWTACWRRSRGPTFVLDFNTEISPHQLSLPDLVRWGTSKEFGDCQRQANHIVRPRGNVTSSGGAQHFERVATAIIPLAMLYLAYTQKHPLTYEGMLDYFSVSGRPLQEVIRDMGKVPYRTLQRGAARLLNQDIRELRRDWAAAAEWLTLWEDPALARTTSCTTIPWMTFQQGSSPMSLYIRVSFDDAKGRLQPVLRLILDQLLFLLSTRDSSDHERELFVILDDVGLLGHLDILEVIAAGMRKYGIRLMLIYQSPTQLWEVSGRYASAILNSCGCWVIFRQNDPDSAGYLVKKFGETTILEPMDRVSSKPFSLWPVKTRSMQAKARELMTAGELQAMRPDEVVVCVDGMLIKGQRIHARRAQPFKRRLGA